MKANKILNLLLMVTLLVFFYTGCNPDLAVENQNAPDTERALSNADDVEALIGGTYLTFWNVTQKSYPGMALSTAADELTSSWGNWHMRWASTEPRIPFDNTTAYSYNNFTETPWYDCYGAISAANNGLKQINNGLVIGDESRTLRAKAFAKLVQGLSHGFLALFFDKAIILDENVDLETDVLDFKPYNEVMDAALVMLEDALAIFEANDFTLPDNWVNGLALTSSDLAALTHSYIARYKAEVARNPQERAAVDWNSVIQHINKGITEDFAPIGDGDNWWTRLHYQGMHPTWVRADYKTIGPADTSGNYQAWLNTPVDDRQPFLIHTADKRITAPGIPDYEETELPYDSSGTDFRFEGNPVHRPDRGTYHFSYYFMYRYEAHYLNDATGPMTAFTTEELDLLKAEALYRLGQGGVADLINNTRVPRGGLPVATDGDADLWEKLMYEKRIETYLAGGAGLAFFDQRGWGELVTGTVIHLPVPAKELEILQLELYTYGGVGGEGAAPKRQHREYLYGDRPQ